MKREKIALERLKEEKYRRVICYPIYKREDFQRRLRELARLHVEAVEFTGQKSVYNIPILGKGCVGLVVVAYRENEKVALKIRRTDADRATMRREAHFLKKANKIGIGTRLFDFTPNFLLMEYVEGVLLPEWIKTVKGKGAKEMLGSVLRSVLEQAWRLDQAGLDHGELSNAPKHIIIKPDDTPCIVDFESASVSRRVSNVTSICQYLFVRSSVAETVQRKLDIDVHSLVDSLRIYKKMKNRESFEEVLSRCKVFEAH
ncbi:MAG: serine/threonine protein kinase [Candidatus Bathyarchaeia archaeon]